MGNAEEVFSVCSRLCTHSIGGGGPAGYHHINHHQVIKGNISSQKQHVNSFLTRLWLNGVSGWEEFIYILQEEQACFLVFFQERRKCISVFHR